VKSSIFKNTLLTFLSAILLYLAYPNSIFSLGFPYVAWFFAVPLFIALEKQPLLQRLLSGFLFGIVFYGLLVHWVYPINPTGYFLFVLLLTIQPLLFSALFKTNFLNKTIGLIYVASLWVISEFLRTILMGGFTWTIGHTQAFFPFIIQTSSFTGGYGISFIIMLVNLCLYKIINRKSIKAINYYISAIILTFIWIVLCDLIIKPVDSINLDNQYSICSVQPNISPKEKTNIDLIDILADRQIALSQECLRNGPVDLIVWPETAITDDFLKDIVLYDKVLEMVKTLQTPVLIGAALLEEGKDLNSAVLVNEQGKVVETYHKQKLIPLNEYYPFEKSLPFLKKHIYKKKYQFHSGDRMNLFPLTHYSKKSVKAKNYFGTIICSEDLYPSLIKKWSQKKVGLMILLLNDAWFQKREAYLLHLQSSIMQAVSFRKPIVRTSNNGISCHINQSGEITNFELTKLKIDEKKTFLLNVLTSQSQSFYAKFGNVFAFFCILFVIIGVLTKKETQ